jgi:hypothetical protein
VPEGSEVVVMTGGISIAIDKAWAAEVLPKLSLTVTEKEEVPFAVGIPKIVPLAEIRVKPAGRDPLVTAQLL